MADLGQRMRMIIHQWLKDNGINLLKDGGFNHDRVAPALPPKHIDSSASAGDFERFEKLFARVNAALT